MLPESNTGLYRVKVSTALWKLAASILRWKNL